MNSEDLLLPFLLEASAIRGCLIRLGPSVDLILHQHNYPQNVGTLLAEATILTVALGSALKFDGIFTLQTKGKGSISMLVADVTSDGGVRAYAKFDSEHIIKEQNLLGAGNLVFTVDQKASGERYQGIVQLEEGETLCQALQTYFKKSEQIPTGFLVAVQCDETGTWHAACLMLQHMPREGGTEILNDTSIEDDWFRTMSLMQTCTNKELLDLNLAAEDLLFRLFHEETVRVFDRKSFHHACRCNRERVGELLSSMPEKEINSIMEKDIATVTCQFCSKTYTFTLAEVAAYRQSKII